MSLENKIMNLTANVMKLSLSAIFGTVMGAPFGFVAKYAARFSGANEQVSNYIDHGVHITAAAILAYLIYRKMGRNRQNRVYPDDRPMQDIQLIRQQREENPPTYEPPTQTIMQ